MFYSIHVCKKKKVKRAKYQINGAHVDTESLQISCNSIVYDGGGVCVRVAAR